MNNKINYLNKRKWLVIKEIETKVWKKKFV